MITLDPCEHPSIDGGVCAVCGAVWLTLDQVIALAGRDPRVAPLSEGDDDSPATRHRITNPSVWVNAMEAPLSEGDDE